LSLNIKPSTSDTPVAPSVMTQPSPQTVLEGESATFNVAASGSWPLSYQWRKNGVNISGATEPGYTTPAVSMADNGAAYDCVVSNDLGSATTTMAILTVTADTQAPTIQSVSAASANSVVVEFSEPVEQSSAEDISNYLIDGGVSVQSATLTGENRVLLSVSTMTDKTAYTLTISNVTDVAQAHNTIASFSTLSFTYMKGEDFENGSTNWTPLTPSRWEVVLDEGDNAYHLNTTNYDGTSGDGLGEYSLLAGSYGDFELSLDAKLGDDITVNPQADFAIVFGYQDADNYYYMMFNNDATYSQLYKVVNGTRESVAATSGDVLNDNAYHSIGISRSGSNITVTFDGGTVLTASDNTFGAGQVGVGSLNDAAYFDNVVVTPVSSGTTTDGGGSSSGSSNSNGGDGTSTGANSGGPTSVSVGGALGPLMLALGLLLVISRRRAAKPTSNLT